MLTTGGLLISIALLTLMAVSPVFRRSDPPRWTTRRWIGELVTLAFVSTLAIGLGYAGAGAISAYQQGPSVADLALLGGVLVAAAVIGRKLRARVRREAVAAVAPVIVAVADRLATNAASPIFIHLANAALDATKCFKLPPGRVVEVGSQVEI